MLKISKLTVENLAEGCVTDNARPRFSFALAADGRDVTLRSAEIAVGDWRVVTTEQIAVPYGGAPLAPFTTYTVTVRATDSRGETAERTAEFATGRLGTPWRAVWISDAAYNFTEKRVSPVPMVFRKKLALTEKPARATVCCTAMGIYELAVDGKKVGRDYFAPGFTSYKTRLQYQTYDVTEAVRNGSELTAVVAGGWAVGSFVFTRKNRITADRQALLLELRLTYADGREEVIGTDESWQVTEDGNYRLADIYDGETYDATVDLTQASWRGAAAEKLRVSPQIIAEYGAPVRAHETLRPVSVSRAPSGELVYDFGQNFAGVVCAEIKGKKGQTVIFRHAEILKDNGELFTELLRSAKATATYVCADGEQTYSPRLTYMGFRYVGVSGIDAEDIELSAFALYSDLAESGSFSCSNEMINKLQSNILWSARSNFVDIPTDCPQRDERMGWTGDIALFARTACYNFDMSRFLDKWLKDVQSEQLKSGGIPNTVPVQGYGFPATMPVMAVDFWGDACVLVPWAEYLARGDVELLRRMYPTMKKYVKACKFWAGFLSFGKRRYIWNTPGVFHFGDWVAPGVPKMSQWQARRTWTATASLANTSGLVARIADILGETEDAAYYKKLNAKVKDAYVSVLTDGKGKLLTEFQTAYVLPLQFGIFAEDTRRAAADNLAALVEKADYCIGTGFPGTPYVLFALADHGRADAAFKMLTNTKCPSWLFEVKAGGTTVWERWDALKEDGSSNTGAEDGTGGMVSFNHYAAGAVGDFLYRRVAGIEPIEAGYKRFRIRPLVGGGITSADGKVETPYGAAASSWTLDGDKFTLKVTVPVSAACEVTLPDGTAKTVGSGEYRFECNIAQE